jgi:tyrosinase
MRVSHSDRQNLDLTPFWKSGSAFHRSTDTPVRDFIKFQATYPEFVGLENLSVAQRKARIQEKVDALYDPNNRRRGLAVTSATTAAFAVAGAPAGAAGAVRASAGAPPVRAGGAGGAGGAPVAAQAVLRAAAPLSVQAALPVAPPPAGDTPETLTALQRLDWFIRIRVKKFQLKQSFTVLIFLGSVPEEVAQWRSSLTSSVATTNLSTPTLNIAPIARTAPMSSRKGSLIWTTRLNDWAMATRARRRLRSTSKITFTGASRR